MSSAQDIQNKTNEKCRCHTRKKPCDERRRPSVSAPLLFGTFGSSPACGAVSAVQTLRLGNYALGFKQHLVFADVSVAAIRPKHEICAFKDPSARITQVGEKNYLSSRSLYHYCPPRSDR